MIYAYTYSIINYKVSNTKQPRKPKALDTTHVNFNRNDDRAVIYTSDTTMMTKFNKLVEIAGTEWKVEKVEKLSKTDEITGITYSCPVNFISFRKKNVEREYTEEQKAAIRERLHRNTHSTS